MGCTTTNLSAHTHTWHVQDCQMTAAAVLPAQHLAAQLQQTLYLVLRPASTTCSSLWLIWTLNQTQTVCSPPTSSCALFKSVCCKSSASAKQQLLGPNGVAHTGRGRAQDQNMHPKCQARSSIVILKRTTRWSTETACRMHPLWLGLQESAQTAAEKQRNFWS